MTAQDVTLARSFPVVQARLNRIDEPEHAVVNSTHFSNKGAIMIRPLICIALCLLLYTSAKADPFTLTLGSAQTGLNVFSLVASGPNISIVGHAGNASGGPPQGDFAFATCTPSPCAPGSVLDVGGFFIAGQLETPNFLGFASINRTDFVGVNFGGLLIFTGSVVLPADYVNGQPVSVPFSMQGELLGFAPCAGNPVGCAHQVFDISVNGIGSAIATLPEPGHPAVTYNFQPVPEPATLGLLGIGLLALKRFCRSRNKP